MIREYELNLQVCLEEAVFYHAMLLRFPLGIIFFKAHPCLFYLNFIVLSLSGLSYEFFQMILFNGLFGYEWTLLKGMCYSHFGNGVRNAAICIMH